MCNFVSGNKAYLALLPKMNLHIQKCNTPRTGYLPRFYQDTLNPSRVTRVLQCYSMEYGQYRDRTTRTLPLKYQMQILNEFLFRIFFGNRERHSSSHPKRHPLNCAHTVTHTSRRRSKSTPSDRDCSCEGIRTLRCSTSILEEGEDSRKKLKHTLRTRRSLQFHHLDEHF